jgi:hypothetical protein
MVALERESRWGNPRMIGQAAVGGQIGVYGE